MVEPIVDWVSRALSYLWELAALPFHSGRLAALRMARRYHEYEFAQSAREEETLLHEAIRVIEKLEKAVAEADLVLEPSREAAIAALLSAVRRLRAKASAAFSEDHVAGKESKK